MCALANYSTTKQVDSQTDNLHSTPEDDEVVRYRRAKITPSKKAVAKACNGACRVQRLRGVHAQRHTGLATCRYRPVDGFGSLIDGPFPWLTRRSYLLSGVQSVQ
jgi:hypothetical protein